MQVLILEEEAALRTDIAAALAVEGCDVLAFGRLDPAKAAARERTVDVLVLGEAVEGRLAHDLALLAEWRNPALAAILLSDRRGEGVEDLFDLIPSLQAVVGRRTAPGMLARLALSAASGGRRDGTGGMVAVGAGNDCSAASRDVAPAVLPAGPAASDATVPPYAPQGVPDVAEPAAVGFADGPAALARVQAGVARLAARSEPLPLAPWPSGLAPAPGTWAAHDLAPAGPPVLQPPQPGPTAPSLSAGMPGPAPLREAPSHPVAPSRSVPRATAASTPAIPDWAVEPLGQGRFGAATLPHRAPAAVSPAAPEPTGAPAIPSEVTGRTSPAARLAALVPAWDPQAELNRRRAQLASRELGAPSPRPLAAEGAAPVPLPVASRPAVPRRLHLA